MRELLERYRDEFTLSDIRLATFVLMHSIHALIHAVALDRPRGISIVAAKRDIVRLALGYLTLPQSKG